MYTTDRLLVSVFYSITGVQLWRRFWELSIVSYTSIPVIQRIGRQIQTNLEWLVFVKFLGLTRVVATVRDEGLKHRKLCLQHQLHWYVKKKTFKIFSKLTVLILLPPYLRIWIILYPSGNNITQQQRHSNSNSHSSRHQSNTSTSIRSTYGHFSISFFLLLSNKQLPYRSTEAHKTNSSSVSVHG